MKISIGKITINLNDEHMNSSDAATYIDSVAKAHVRFGIDEKVLKAKILQVYKPTAPGKVSGRIKRK